VRISYVWEVKLPEFEVHSTDDEGNASVTTESADSVEGIVGRLRAEGLQASEITAPRARRLFEPRRVEPEEFALFNSELAAACRQGAPLPAALRTLADELRGARVQEALELVARDLEGGTDLASALSRRGDCFPPGYVALVRAGLASGDLAGTLLLFSEQARLSARLRRTMARVIIYPSVVVIAATAFLCFAGWVLLPGFKEAFLDMEIGGGHLPPVTAFVFWLAPAFRWAPAILFGSILFAVLAWRVVSRRASSARMLGRLVLAIPGFGSYFRAVALTRFARTLSNAIASGIPVHEAVSLAGMASGNAAVMDAAEKIRARAAEGVTLADGIKRERAVFPLTLVWMLSLGEKRGDVRQPLDEYAALQEDRVRRLGETLPMIVTAVVGIFGSILLGICVMAIFQPLIDLMKALGGGTI
jgi:type IV pilus assembly protein PilC